MSKIDCNYHSRTTREKDCNYDINEREYMENPKYNPLRLEKDYVRALNATKIDKFMSKPLIKTYMLHNEGINKLERYKTNFITASYSNEIIIWDLLQRVVKNKYELSTVINTIGINDKYCFASQDKSILLLDNQSDSNHEFCYDELYGFNNNTIDKHKKFSTSQLNKMSYSSKIDSKYTITWMNIKDTNVVISTLNNYFIYSLDQNSYAYERSGECKFIKFNASFPGLIGGINNSKMFVEDIRSNTKIISIKGAYNCFNFYEDMLYIGGDNYTVFDMRNIEKPIKEYDIVGSVLSIDNTCKHGKNRTVLGTTENIIYTFNKEALSDIYYNQRMGLVHGVKYSGCGNYIISGSDDGNIRLWKAISNQKSLISAKEKKSIEERVMLQYKFKNINEIERIKKHIFLPKDIKQKIKEQNIKRDKLNRTN